MKKLPASLLFLAAAIYLATQGEFDLITVFAVLICSLCGAITFTNQSIWALIGGIGLISVSLSMQAIIKSICMTCLKTDLLILAAVTCLSLVQRGNLKKPARGMALIMTIILSAVTFIAVPISSSTTPAAAQNISSKLDPNKLDAEIQKAAETKPVLLFSPKCSACKEVTDELAKLDPKGQKWQPVQSGGDPQEGIKYLQDKGYTGKMAFHRFSGGVPALVIKQDGQIKIIRGKVNIIKAVSTPAE